MGVFFRQQGNFSKTEKYLQSLLQKNYLSIIDKYGKMGVEALRAATPVNTGLAASSWAYQVEQDPNGVILSWFNSDIEGGTKVVILLDRGHATKSGTWVPGYHFIENAINPVIDALVAEIMAGKEV